jgi:tetraacyldisaccharide 4'-kinase
MKSSRFTVPVINVGNLSMGGTGKTPHVEYLIRLLMEDYQIATLSRGFGRKERGFKLADENSTADQIGDEPLQYFKKYGNEIKVAVEANRVLGAMDLFRQHPDINVLLLDDAYQHRAIHASLNILLTDYNAPFYKDFILPTGNLRECRSGKNRADAIIVTKCPEFEKIDKQRVIARINPKENQKVYFSSIRYHEVFDFSTNSIDIQDRNIILVTGIANARPLVDFISEKANILKHFNYPDHHKFRPAELREIHNIFDKFAKQEPLIVTTEKDAMRLLSKDFKEEIKNYPWCYQTIEVQIDNEEEFNNLVLEHVKENH